MRRKHWQKALSAEPVRESHSDVNNLQRAAALPLLARGDGSPGGDHPWGAAWHGLALGTGYRHWMVLTLGGRPRAGLRVAIQVQQSGNAFKLGVLDTADTFTELCPFRLGELTK